MSRSSMAEKLIKTVEEYRRTNKVVLSESVIAHVIGLRMKEMGIPESSPKLTPLPLSIEYFGKQEKKVVYKVDFGADCSMNLELWCNYEKEYRLNNEVIEAAPDKITKIINAIGGWFDSDQESDHQFFDILFDFDKTVEAKQTLFQLFYKKLFKGYRDDLLLARSILEDIKDKIKIALSYAINLGADFSNQDVSQKVLALLRALKQLERPLPMIFRDKNTLEKFMLNCMHKQEFLRVFKHSFIMPAFAGQEISLIFIALLANNQVSVKGFENVQFSAEVLGLREDYSVHDEMKWSASKLPAFQNCSLKVNKIRFPMIEKLSSEKEFYDLNGIIEINFDTLLSHFNDGRRKKVSAIEFFYIIPSRDRENFLRKIHLKEIVARANNSASVFGKWKCKVGVFCELINEAKCVFDKDPLLDFKRVEVQGKFDLTYFLSEDDFKFGDLRKWCAALKKLNSMLSGDNVTFSDGFIIPDSIMIYVHLDDREEVRGKQKISSIIDTFQGICKKKYSMETVVGSQQSAQYDQKKQLTIYDCIYKAIFEWESCIDSDREKLFESVIKQFELMKGVKNKDLDKDEQCKLTEYLKAIVCQDEKANMNENATRAALRHSLLFFINHKKNIPIYQLFSDSVSEHIGKLKTQLVQIRSQSHLIVSNQDRLVSSVVPDSAKRESTANSEESIMSHSSVETDHSSSAVHDSESPKKCQVASGQRELQTLERSASEKKSNGLMHAKQVRPIIDSVVGSDSRGLQNLNKSKSVLKNTKKTSFPDNENNNVNESQDRLKVPDKTEESGKKKTKYNERHNPETSSSLEDNKRCANEIAHGKPSAVASSSHENADQHNQNLSFELGYSRVSNNSTSNLFLAQAKNQDQNSSLRNNDDVTSSFPADLEQVENQEMACKSDLFKSDHDRLKDLLQKNIQVGDESEEILKYFREVVNIKGIEKATDINSEDKVAYIKVDFNKNVKAQDAKAQDAKAQDAKAQDAGNGKLDAAHLIFRQSRLAQYSAEELLNLSRKLDEFRAVVKNNPAVMPEVGLLQQKVAYAMEFRHAESLVLSRYGSEKTGVTFTVSSEQRKHFGSYALSHLPAYENVRNLKSESEGKNNAPSVGKENNLFSRFKRLFSVDTSSPESIKLQEKSSVEIKPVFDNEFQKISTLLEGFGSDDKARDGVKDKRGYDLVEFEKLIEAAKAKLKAQKVATFFVWPNKNHIKNMVVDKYLGCLSELELLVKQKYHAKIWQADYDKPVAPDGSDQHRGNNEDLLRKYNNSLISYQNGVKFQSELSMFLGKLRIFVADLNSNKFNIKSFNHFAQDSSQFTLFTDDVNKILDEIKSNGVFVQAIKNFLRNKVSCSDHNQRNDTDSTSLEVILLEAIAKCQSLKELESSINSDPEKSILTSVGLLESARNRVEQLKVNALKGKFKNNTATDTDLEAIAKLNLQDQIIKSSVQEISFDNVGFIKLILSGYITNLIDNNSVTIDSLKVNVEQALLNGQDIEAVRNTTKSTLGKGLLTRFGLLEQANKLIVDHDNFLELLEKFLDPTNNNFDPADFKLLEDSSSRIKLRDDKRKLLHDAISFDDIGFIGPILSGYLDNLIDGEFIPLRVLENQIKKEFEICQDIKSIKITAESGLGKSLLAYFGLFDQAESLVENHDKFFVLIEKFQLKNFQVSDVEEFEKLNVKVRLSTNKRGELSDSLVGGDSDLLSSVVIKYLQALLIDPKNNSLQLKDELAKAINNCNDTGVLEKFLQSPFVVSYDLKSVLEQRIADVKHIPEQQEQFHDESKQQLDHQQNSNDNSGSGTTVANNRHSLLSTNTCFQEASSERPTKNNSENPSCMSDSSKKLSFGAAAPFLKGSGWFRFSTSTNKTDKSQSSGSKEPDNKSTLGKK